MKIDLGKHPRLTAPGVKTLFEAFPQRSLRFVGGCVRNALWGEPLGDIDFATTLEPQAVMDRLKAKGIRVIPTGIDHGTVTAVLDDEPFEITTLRKDVETDGRRAVVAFTTDWAEDALRRDLTVNALYMDAVGEVFDPYGEGLKDLEPRRFRFVGDADARVREDYLRILRFFRFLARYGGQGKIDADALRACRENRDGLKTLSAERVWSEIKKILGADDPVSTVRIMGTNGILETVLREASNVEGLELMVELEKAEGRASDPLLRLMAMAARDELAMARLCQRLKMSTAEKTRLMGWAGNAANFDPDLDVRALKIRIYASGSQTAQDRMLIRAAGESDPILRARRLEMTRFAAEWKRPTFPLKGRDLQAAGVPPGPEMGKVLKALQELWVRSGFTADKDKLLNALALIRGVGRAG